VSAVGRLRGVGRHFLDSAYQGAPGYAARSVHFAFDPPAAARSRRNSASFLLTNGFFLRRFAIVQTKHFKEHSES
jgi:hypothetical protein